MRIEQETINLGKFRRGMHLITARIERMPVFSSIEKGIAHIFIQHTSASLTINENADPTVRQDLNMFLDALIPDGDSRYTHQYEGPDDMPAHIKASVLGSSVTVPIQAGKLLLGTWQGVYLCEHRDEGGDRKITVTLLGN